MAILLIIIVFGILIYIHGKNRCDHNMVKVSYTTEYDECRNMMYSMRTYKCSKCDHTDVVDGRTDPYDKH